jgi:Flp pilus assembly protein TadG
MLRKVAWARLKQAVAAFASCEGGNIAMIFSMTLVPTIFLAGAAVDYSGASNLRTKLQRATDGANMQLCLMPVNSTQTQLEQAARTAMAGYMGDRPFRVVSVVPTTKPRQVLLTTSADFQTAIVRAVNANFATVPVNASATCFAEQQTFEIALVLDNTGSMNNSAGGLSKMQAMRTAATNFVNTIFSDPMMVGHTKMSLVPFAATVAVNPSTYRNASWIDQNGKAANHWSFVQGGAATVTGFASFGIKSRLDVYNHLKSFVPSWDWNGCFESLPYPLNTQDGAPATNNKDSYYVPIFAPDESGDGAQYQHDTNGVTVYSLNSYMNDTAASPLPHPLPACTTASDEATKTGQACKYVQPNNVKTSMVVPYLGTIPIGPNTSCTTRPLTRMTATASTLTSEISALTAQQQAKTNIHEGFMWGWRTISPISVFADGAPYTKEFNHKIIILMTDGTNTWTSNSYNPTLKSTYSAYGFFKNPDGSTANTRVPIANPTTDADSRAAIDALTLESCKKARDAGVKIFTIGFSVTGDTIDQKGLKLLSDCAANSKQSFVAHNSSDIDSVLQEIAQSIGRLRLSM